MWLFGDHGRLIKRCNPDSLKSDFSVLSSDVTVYNELLRKNADLFEEAFYEKKKLDPQMRTLLNSLAKLQRKKSWSFVLI